MSILVTGGAGYIGSIIVEQLVGKKEEVVVLDNLVQGHREAVSGGALFVKGDVGNESLLKEIMEGHQIKAVIHMAAETVVERSMTDPKVFFHENVIKGIVLLDAILEHSVDKVIFSSSAALYGKPEEVPITEEHPKDPINAYGESKRMFEIILEWYRRAYELKYISLRYFNAAGASERFGEDHNPESHLIPLVLKRGLEEVKSGKYGVGSKENPASPAAPTNARNGVTSLKIFGSDYSTRDGTCIRDYIHVVDLARAHILALSVLDKLKARTYNLGSGEGYTVREVIETARMVTGVSIPAVEAGRRPGDPAVLVASAKLAKEELAWEPQYSDLETIIRSAWEWKRKHPDGYSA